MSLGLEALLEAAQFLEQQEKLKLSPQPAAPTITINEQRYFVQRPNANYENAMATATSTAAGVGHNNNTIVSGTGKNLKMRHFNAVSASAPAAGATFHHTNGLTITSCSSSNNNSQLIGATNRSNDYEYRNGNSVNVTGTTQQPGAATSCSRSSEGHLIEDQFSSNVVITNKKFTTSPKATSSKTTTNSTTSSSDSLMLTRIKSSEQSPQLQQLQQQQQHHQITTFATTVTQKPPQSLQPPQLQQPQQQQLQYSNNKNKSAADFTLAAGKSVVVSAAASKQMLLNGGVRVAAPAASIGIIVKSSSSSASAAIPPKTIASTPNQLLQQPQQQLSHTSPVLSASSSFSSSSSHPIYTAPNSSAPHALNLHRHKKCNPLTPPPMPSKKFVETNTRIRSFSLSSNKFTVGTAAAANSTNSTTGSPNQQQHVLLQQASEDSHMSYVSGGGSSGASPPRHHHHHHHQLNGAGSHYIQMMSSAASGSSQAGPAAPLIGGSGRRRTISSNSNGAGTREVHNKLEKNRRAHLKECYEQLKNQLQLRDEDRKKTSNLAILGEAYKHVIALKRKDQELEAQVEQLAKEKINAQKKIVSLKRELGPKFEQYFASIIPDDLSSGSIPVERENLNDSSSLCSSGRGSLLYSSSSSLSSGGSSNSNTVSSPIGAGLPTALPAALSPVITQKITNSYSASSCVITTTTPTTATASATASPISPTVLLQQIKSETHSAESSPALGVQGSNSSQGQLSPVSSPTTSLSGVVNMPLSLTAKNISATSLTRGSPTPLTPSPSPSSSSGVSSSSSIMSSSPPSVNGVISGRNVTVNIPNGLKFQTTTAGHTQQHSGTHNTGAAATIRGPQAAAAAASGGPAAAMSSNNNNATAGAATAGAATTAATAKLNASTTAASVNTPQHAIGGRSNSQPRKTSFFFEVNNRKISGDESFKSALQDGEQPAKLLKVFDNSSNNNNNNSSFVAMSPLTTPNSSPSHDAIQPPSAISKKLTAVGANSSRIANNCSDSSLVLCPTPTSTSTTTTTTANQVLASQQLQITKVIIKKGGSGSGGGGFMSHAAQLRRPSGSVAETNILPNHVAHLYGAETAAGNDAAATFFQTNGKLTLLNGGGDGSGCSNGTFLFKATTDHQHHSTLSLLNDVSNVVRLTPTPAPTVTAASLHFSSLAPLVAASAETTVPTAAPTPLSYFGNSGGNFAQLLAAAATAAAGNVAAPRATVERRRNSKVST